MATAEERSRAARIAALARWSREDPQASAERGQVGLRRKFEREIDPDGTLEPADLATRVDRAIRAHMIKLSARGVAARRARSTSSPAA